MIICYENKGVLHVLSKYHEEVEDVEGGREMFFEDLEAVKQSMQSCVDKYRGDNTIFSKAIQNVSMFANQSEWPHNFPVMARVVSSALGTDIKTVLLCAEHLTNINDNDDELYDFFLQLPAIVDELKSFHYILHDFLQRSSRARVAPLEFFSIVRSTRKMENKEKTIYRFIRMDGETFDLELSRSNIEKMKNILVEILQKDTELE